MTSTSNAVSAGPRGGVSWQVDIPSLSQLIVSFGSHGLKQLALSGVDIHSIGCMLMIAEYTPCSNNFRRLLNRARSEQRAERLWLYKMVEIGGSTNFLADQLLKTRAGENVLALMAATASIMSEDTCTTLLGALFESANVALDNIPGFNQLQSITSALAPLARRTGFSEKLFHHHHLFCALTDPTSIRSTADRYMAIPHVDVLPKLIQMLHKLITSEESFLVVFKGLEGAAWLATYGTQVLGLNTCVVFPDAKEFPLLGSYEDARIILKLGESSSSCELYHTGDLQDHITGIPAGWDIRRGWSIDCSKINYIDVVHPGLIGSQSFAKLSRFVAMEALNASSHLSQAFIFHMSDEAPNIRAEVMARFRCFIQSQLPEVHARCLRILEILGFLPGKLSSYAFTNSERCEGYSCIGNKEDPESVRFHDGETLRVYRDRDEKSSSDIDSTFLIIEREGKPRPVLGRYFMSTQIPREHFPDGIGVRLTIYMNDFSDSDSSPVNYADWQRPGPSTDIRDKFIAWKYTLQDDVAHTMKMAVHFASNLAWTDWDETLRLMNVDMISRRYETLISKASRQSRFEGNMAHAISLCTHALEARHIEDRLWSRGWIALDIDGLVVIRNAARSQTTQLRGVFLSFQRGQISYGGTPCYKICADIETNSRISMSPEVPPHDIVPYDCLKNLSMRAVSHNDRGIIWIRHEVLNDHEFLVAADPDYIASRIRGIWISEPCEHPYAKPFNVETTSIVLRGMRDGFFMGVNDSSGANIHKTNGLDVTYQQTDGNLLGQWLALQWQAGFGSFGLVVLQQQCCLGCILKRVDALSNYALRFHGGKRPKVCIIAARPEGEAEDLQRDLP